MNKFKRVSDLTLDQAEKITERMHNAAYDVSDLSTSPTVLESISALLVRLEFLERRLENIERRFNVFGSG